MAPRDVPRTPGGLKGRRSPGEEERRPGDRGGASPPFRTLSAPTRTHVRDMGYSVMTEVKRLFL